MAEGDHHDLKALVSSTKRDFLVKNNGDQVKIDNLSGKIIGLYFSASWCGPCLRFTPNLVDVYAELIPKGDFEVIFVSLDKNEEAFNGYFSKMPWLAIPFSDSETKDHLKEVFKINGIPHLVILDADGKVLTDEGVGIIGEYRAEGYPFTPERIQEMKDQEAAARREQSLKSILVSPSRDFLISNGGKQVPVLELEGKMVGLYFALSSFRSSLEFTPKLIELYEKLKEREESFEVVLIPLDEDEESFNECFGGMPWLALPVKDKTCEKLVRYFELSTLPTLVIIGPDGKTLNSNVAEVVEEHGVQAYPFTPEKFAELAALEKARQEAQTLESILVMGDRDFVIGKDGTTIPVLELVGKNILLYFSAHWCPPCRAFLPQLIKVYHQIKAKDDAFEVIFISSDKNQVSFDEFFSSMPWLALPYGDERKKVLSRMLKVQGIPMAVAIGPTGRTITKEARELLMNHGADAYPFTSERLKEIEAQLDEMAKGWPEKVKHALHEEHELVLTRRSSYLCDGCEEDGNGWSFYCEECDFDLHPKCALEENKGAKDDGKGKLKGKEDDYDYDYDYDYHDDDEEDDDVIKGKLKGKEDDYDDDDEEDDDVIRGKLKAKEDDYDDDDEDDDVIKGKLKGKSKAPQESFVGSYKVKYENGVILQLVFDRYGDICSDCQMKCTIFRSTFLEEICKILISMQQKTLRDLSPDDLINWKATLDDVLTARIKVEWLIARYIELAAAQEVKRHLDAVNQEREEMLSKVNAFNEVKRALVEAEVQLEAAMAKVKSLKKDAALVTEQRQDLEKQMKEVMERYNSVRKEAEVFKRFMDGNLAQNLL